MATDYMHEIGTLLQQQQQEIGIHLHSFTNRYNNR